MCKDKSKLYKLLFRCVVLIKDAVKKFSRCFCPIPFRGGFLDPFHAFRFESFNSFLTLSSCFTCFSRAGERVFLHPLVAASLPLGGRKRGKTARDERVGEGREGEYVEDVLYFSEHNRKSPLNWQKLGETTVSSSVVVSSCLSPFSCLLSLSL